MGDTKLIHEGVRSFARLYFKAFTFKTLLLIHPVASKRHAMKLGIKSMVKIVAKSNPQAIT
ncbi:MAG: hypothetical protein KAG61_06750, partial [Bacteriovoracaceae bacterium]|nr:hypothetical protein [Bacteriovoracaceae bacterium]